MGIESENARDDALKDISLLVQRTGSRVLEQVTWLLWELVGRNNFSTFVLLAMVPGSYSTFKITLEFFILDLKRLMWDLVCIN